MSDVFTAKKIVSVCDSKLDPAVDYEAMDIPAYAENFDEKLVIVKEGMTPDWISIIPLKRMDLVRCMDTLPGDYTRKAYACSVGCQSITLSNGTIMMPDKSDKNWQDKWFDQICDKFGIDYAIVVGSVVLKVSRLPKV